MARRRADLWDDLFEALRWLFSVVHPAWSIPVAAVFFFIPVISGKSNSEATCPLATISACPGVTGNPSKNATMVSDAARTRSGGSGWQNGQAVRSFCWRMPKRRDYRQ
jgi:hypothetical protein